MSSAPEVEPKPFLTKTTIMAFFHPSHGDTDSIKYYEPRQSKRMKNFSEFTMSNEVGIGRVLSYCCEVCTTQSTIHPVNYQSLPG